MALLLCRPISSQVDWFLGMNWGNPHGGASGLKALVKCPKPVRRSAGRAGGRANGHNDMAREIGRDY